MDPAILSALSAVLGSLVGGSATFATAWVTQNTKSKREMVAAEILKREILYGDFISECSKLAVDALDHSLDTPSKLFEVYALKNRIGLGSSTPVVAAAESTMHRILQQYLEPNMPLEHFRKLSTLSPDDPALRADPLRPFSEACRLELAALRIAS